MYLKWSQKELHCLAIVLGETHLNDKTLTKSKYAIIIKIRTVVIGGGVVFLMIRKEIPFKYFSYSGIVHFLDVLFGILCLHNTNSLNCVFVLHIFYIIFYFKM